MVLTIIHSYALINEFNIINTNQQVYMADAPAVRYALSPFEETINPRYQYGIKLYFQAKKEIDKEFDKLDVLVSNVKYIIDNFLSLDNKYGWGRFAFMVETGADAKNIFKQVEQIQISYIYHQVHGYFGSTGIENVVSALPNPVVVSDLLNLSTS